MLRWGDLVKAKKCSSGKLRFTHRKAMLVVTNAKIRRYLHASEKRRESRCYECPECGWWHVTSQEERVPA